MMQSLTSLYGRAFENHAKTLMVDLASGTDAMTPASLTARHRIETPEGRARLEEMGLEVFHVDIEPLGVNRSIGGTMLPPEGNWHSYEAMTVVNISGYAAVVRYGSNADFSARIRLIKTEELGGWFGWFPDEARLGIATDCLRQEIWHWGEDRQPVRRR